MIVKHVIRADIHFCELRSIPRAPKGREKIQAIH